VNTGICLPYSTLPKSGLQNWRSSETIRRDCMVQNPNTLDFLMNMIIFLYTCFALTRHDRHGAEQKT
jgi:hypothetical protein